MHAGNVKYGHPLQGQAAEVQRCSTALETEQQSQGIGPQTGHQIGSNAYVLGPAPPLTSIVRLSLSFLQEAEMVSEVANSKYHSLFFIL